MLAELVTLITLHGPAGQRIDINAREITSVREPSGQHHRSIRCLVAVSGSGRIGVIESCEKVRQLLKESS